MEANSDNRGTAVPRLDPPERSLALLRVASGTSSTAGDDGARVSGSDAAGKYGNGNSNSNRNNDESLPGPSRSSKKPRTDWNKTGTAASGGATDADVDMDGTASPAKTFADKKHQPDAGELILRRLLQKPAKNKRDNSSSEGGKSFLRVTMQLEAIFHPKFENENLNDSSIREAMQTSVREGSGYLEVTLKHSGSLLLWNGARFFSKNSTGNKFTLAGELLLRQHFARAWRDGEGSTIASNRHNDDDEEERMYLKCCREVSSRRLSLAFECVTSVLGQHGDVPHRDYLILTAVADMSSTPHHGRERFFTSTELIHFAHRWRLPHNDTWVFSTKDSAERLFALYDTTRETGMATDTVDRLTGAANVYVESMYPHVTFQGDILEGIVIRLVNYEGNVTDESRSFAMPETTSTEDGQEVTESQRQQRLLESLAKQSKRILDAVPASMPPVYKLGRNAYRRPVLCTDLRKLFEQHETDDEIMDALNETLGVSAGKFSSPTADRVSAVNISSIVSNLLNNASSGSDQTEEVLSCDLQTQRIAVLINTMQRESISVEYKVFRVVPDRNHRENCSIRSESSGGSSGYECLCIIHVLNDSAFQKYHKKKQTSDMMLYRGFCIRILVAEMPHAHRCAGPSSLQDDMQPANKSITTELSYQSGPHRTYMLKMKFLPYMVRTFGCRNGMGVLARNGPHGFDAYISNLFSKWGISPSARERWVPYLHAWGVYAYPKLKTDGVRLETQASSSSCDQEHSTSIVTKPLTQGTYLDHLAEFNNLYHRGLISGETDLGSTFRGLVLIVGIDTNHVEVLCEAIASEFGCAWLPKLKGIDKNIMAQAVSVHGGGLVCGCSVTDKGLKNIRSALLPNYKDAIYVINLIYSDDDIDIILGVKEKGLSGKKFENEKKKIKGLSQAWKKLRVASNLDLQAKCVAKLSSARSSGDRSISAEFQAMPAEITSVLEQLRASSENLPKPDTRAGMLVYFPGVPGSGKSTVCQGLDSELKMPPSDKHAIRPVILRIGDETKEKYWPLVGREKLEQSSSIYVADKNAPPTAWGTINEICLAGRSIAVPVIPAGAALATTGVTDIEGSTTGEAKRKAGLEKFGNNVYPFALHYLAVCMLRVLNRPAESHCGKLDSSTECACMVVVKFFSFYRGLTDDGLLQLLLGGQRRVKEEMVIQVPFFVSEHLPELPSGLKDALVSAIRMQCELDKHDNGKGNESNPGEVTKQRVLEMEQRLRSLLNEHMLFLDTLTVDEQESKQSFISQLSKLVASLDEVDEGALRAAQVTSSRNKRIKLVSIDVERETVHRILRSTASESSQVGGFLRKIEKTVSLPGSPAEDGDDATGRDRCIMNTHVTMAHESQLSQNEMVSQFGAFVGSEVQLTVTSFLFSEKIAALSVSSIKAADLERAALPPCKNSYPHITVWCAADASSYQSNELPAQLEQGEAERVDFSEPYTIRGVLSFWN